MNDSLVSRLGFSDDQRVVIVSADALGRSHAANAAILDVLVDGIASSASVAMPCPWSRHALSHYRGEDVGVQITLNAENDLLRWGPLTASPSLLDGDGGFPRTLLEFWDHADTEEVRRECRAQIQRAALWGLDVSHLTSHLHALAQRPEFFDVLVEVAVDYKLPIRLQNQTGEASAGFPFRSLAADEGIITPDRIIEIAAVDDPTLNELVDSLEVGVTELIFSPALDTPELRAIEDEPSTCIAHYNVLRPHSTLDTALKTSGIECIGYEPLRSLMREGN
ncbi:MAG: ChbG/HpnK family deacetylase [Acidobacteria bacterium]|nr:ChbG/HpnK family deacetylase [Acidobacteriota bacterium]